VGIVADLQCGGWSTTLLNSTGQLYAVGELNGLRFRHKFTPELQRLAFPPGYAQSICGRYEPATAIKQYSCGRMHVLGLSDSGKIWQWDDIEMPAMHIKFLHTDLLENSSRGGRGTVTRVVTGWDRASAYVVGTGIVYWDPDVGADYGAETTDGLLIDAVAIPGTSYQRQKNERQTTREAGDKIGEVIKHIVLEGYIVFITDLNRAFAVKSSFPDDGSHEVVELITVGDALGDGTSKLQDIQGSFRSFAVFTTTGEVLTADRNFLDTFWESKVHGQACDELPRPGRIPALQHNGVFSVAFGDYHFHALHSNGQISSFGTEPQWCGALGLGSRFKGAILRGVRYLNHFNDGKLVRRAYTSGHRIWFEPEKKMWLEHMADVSEHPEAVPRMRMVIESEQVNGEVSEWFEQEGRGWDDFKDLEDADDHGLGAYFALTVAAAGWHSGALVLVDEERAAKVREKYLVKPVALPQADRDEAVDDLEEQPSMVGGAINWLYRIGRSFLGLNSQTNQHSDRRTGSDTPKGSLGEDVVYIWHDQPFPRIRLSTGEEMPGKIPLSEWRYGVPGFAVHSTESSAFG